jgi:glutamyl-tRNA synthetase
MKKVTRFAPSPTGNPHIGNIRTALFAYLYAKSQKGDFLLRIEDTDRSRFVPESIEYIEESLKWLEINYDGEKIFQSDHLPKYQEEAQELIASGHAYKCFCSSERLADLRKDQEAKKQAPGYDGHCAGLTKEEVEEKEKSGEVFVVRLRIPKSGSATWDDLVRGKVEIKYETQDDPIILKSDGWPTYHLANIIDDHQMGITTVIRGEEWIPSTPKHIALYKAFGWEMPTFAHLPVILGPDKSKLSKRHGDTAILDYRDKGYLPEAMVNFLALLGWNDGTEDEIFSIDDFIKRFDILRVQKSPAVFDIEKLNWLNGMYIRKCPNKDLLTKIEELYPKADILKSDNAERIIEVEKTRLTTLEDITSGEDFFYTAPKNVKKILVFKKSNIKDSVKGLTNSLKALEALSGSDWEKYSVDQFEELLKKAVSESELSNGDVFWPIRVALSGIEKSPAPTELLWVLGKDESVRRITSAIGEMDES